MRPAGSQSRRYTITGGKNMSKARPGTIPGKTKTTLYLDSDLHMALRIRSAETKESMSDILERALRKELEDGNVESK